MPVDVRLWLEAFGSDLERAKSVAPEHLAAGSDRVQVPSLEFGGDGRGRGGSGEIWTLA